MKIVMLSGGVGGARFARGLAAVPGVELTVVVNVADDDWIYGVAVSPDVDTVVYTLAGVEGPHGWGRADESWNVMEELGRFPIDASFRLGDRDLALCLFRTHRLREGSHLSEVTDEIRRLFGIQAQVLPVTDDPIRTRLRPSGSEAWLDFQTYFVRRRHTDPVEEVRFEGATEAEALPAVLEAIAAAEAVVVGPSNPILSVHPILAVPGVEAAVAAKARVLAVSPLRMGRSFKGPAAELLVGLGYPPGNRGVVAAYRGLLTDLVVDEADRKEDPGPVRVWASDIDVSTPERARRLAEEVVAWLK